MKKWTINRLVLTGFMAAVLFLALLAGIAGHSLTASLDIDQDIHRSTDILVEIQKLNSSMALAMAGSSAGMLSGLPGPALQYQAALEALTATLDHLDELAGDDLELQVNLQQLRQIADARAHAMQQAQAAHKRGDMAAILQHMEEDRLGDTRMQSIFSDIALRQTALKKQLHDSENASILRLQICAAVLLLGLVLLLAGLYFAIRRNLQREEAHIELEKSEALLRQVLTLLPVGVLVTDHKGALSMMNPAAHDIWGTTSEDELHVPESFRAWRTDTGAQLQPEEYGIIKALQRGDVTIDREFEICRTDGQRRILRTSAMPLRGSQQQIIGAITVNVDLTDIRHAEQALQAAHDALEARVAMRTRELMIANAQLKCEVEERRRVEEALRQTQNTLTIAQRVAHVGSWKINPATQSAQWSDEFFRICGLEPGSVTPSIPAGVQRVHPDDRQMISAKVMEAVKARREYRATLRIIRPDGSLRYVLLQGEPIPNGDAEPVVLIGSMLDITEQMQTEQMLRQLAVHQQTIKEEERKRIAREIHDEMGQNLLALRIDVSMLHARTAASHPRLHGKVETVLHNIDNTIKSVRAIINNLRPVVLDLGLHASFQWQIAEFQRRTGLACELFAKADELDQGLTEAQTTTLFRILQESLTNVARHANASCVIIALSRKEARLHMEIADDGVGMYPGDRRKSKSFGLLGIRERLSAIGGEMTVQSKPGEGTVLTLSIPLEYDTADTTGQERLSA